MWQSFLLKWLLVSAWLVPGKLFEVEVVTFCILHTTVTSQLVLSLFPSFGFLVVAFSFVTSCGQLKCFSNVLVTAF
uniref:Secreted protein n=1 Tax=Ixodes ricinus TaxID=34613 RepID=A0A6B0U4H4_IXORI